MKIKCLYIKDFGIFFQQKLDDLAPGLVLIGGRNRAGKSTFLQILRHLGFGFPRSVSLPPAREKYEVEGEIRLEKGELCYFRLQGTGEPVVSALSGNRDRILSMQEIYGGLDPFTYRQVFTVSLDELQRLPREVSRSDQERLQAVLLGAGFTEIARLPQLEEEYRKRAAEIGGKYGKPGVQRFKEYAREIAAGMEERDRALRQVEEYQVKKKERRECEEEIERCGRELAALRVEIDRLDVLKSNYDGYRQYSELGLRLATPEAQALLRDFPANILSKVEKLRERYEEAAGKYREDLERLRREIPAEDAAAAGKKFLREKEELHRLGRRLSGLKEKVRNFREQQDWWKQEEKELVVETVQVNEEWKDDFERVLAVKADSLELGELARKVEAYRESMRELMACEKELVERGNEITRLKELAGREKAVRPAAAVNRYFALALLFVLLGTGLSFYHPQLGVVTAVAGIIGALLYLTAVGPRRNEQRLMYQHLLAEKQRYMEGQKKRVELRKALRPLEEELHRYRRLLGLPAETPPEIIKDYFQQVQELKRRIGRWRVTGERLEETRRELEKDLVMLRKLAGRLPGILPAVADGEEWREEFFAGLEQAVGYLELVEKLEASRTKQEAAEGELCLLLNYTGEPAKIPEILAEFLCRAKDYQELDRYRVERSLLQKQILQSLKTDRVKTALQAFAAGGVLGEEELFAAFSRLFQEYTSREEVENRYHRARQKVEELEKELEELKEKERRLRDELEQLAATERLEEAQLRIDRARAGMRPLAEKYAVYSAAAFLLEKVRKSFLEKTRGTLLREAGTILARLTAGQYQEVLPADDFREVDFKTVAGDGTLRETAAVLSRATQEQLFLAVRLSRIREIPVPLPVILDDSLVNFDRSHLERAVELLRELVDTHQVFVLTCHPHLVEAVQAEIPAVQYWRLEEGKFKPAGAAGLIKHLSGRQV